MMNMSMERSLQITTTGGDGVVGGGGGLLVKKIGRPMKYDSDGNLRLPSISPPPLVFIEAYVEIIRQPYVWGGEPELLMASHVLKWLLVGNEREHLHACLTKHEGMILPNTQMWNLSRITR
ncbi:unnamed protein product [Camellia sinensis]